MNYKTHISINTLWVLTVLSTLLSCVHPKPRKPVSHAGKVDMTRSIAFNRKLSNHEAQRIASYMQKDSTHQYINSHSGFWYAYITKNDEATYTPVEGNVVHFTYDIKDLDGKRIYTEDELGEQTYIVDQQDVMKGLQEGIKLMKIHEKVIFLLPSQKAYAFHGDEKKIGNNTPLVVTVELKRIKTN